MADAETLAFLRGIKVPPGLTHSREFVDVLVEQEQQQIDNPTATLSPQESRDAFTKRLASADLSHLDLIAAIASLDDRLEEFRKVVNQHTEALKLIAKRPG